jgi:hypothetical protein
VAGSRNDHSWYGLKAFGRGGKLKPVASNFGYGGWSFLAPRRHVAYFLYLLFSFGTDILSRRAMFLSCYEDRDGLFALWSVLSDVIAL